MSSYATSTTAIHADDTIECAADLAPCLHLSTTFIADNPDNLVYYRQDQPTRRRLEAVLGALEGGLSVTYASGQAATFAALHCLQPRRVAIDRGYFGTHDLLARVPGVEVIDLQAPLAEGDLIWLETPKNPYCDIEDIEACCLRAAQSGAKVVVDSTLATPVLQRPLEHGADMVMHSTTKFISGHSDAMGGVLVVKDQDLHRRLMHERDELGSVPGALETWLTLRSTRTLDLRVRSQGATACRIAQWLSGKVEKVWHHSLPTHPGQNLSRKQMDGYSGVLCFEVACEKMARALPGNLKLFRDATSLGGAASTLEWRFKYDRSVSRKLLRVSTGLEAADDLIGDLEQGLTTAGAV